MAAPNPPARHVLLVADGDVPVRARLDEAWPGWSDGIDRVIAADGGLLRAERLGFRPDVLVGDLDSLSAAEVGRAAAAGVEVRRASADKDESDTELALVAAIGLGAGRITVLGAFGGARLDHALANLGLLAHPALAAAAIPVVLLDAGARVSLLTAPGSGGQPVERPLPGPRGGLVSLLPFGGDVIGVTTAGLGYPLRDEDLAIGPARGLSNVRVDEAATVTVRRGRLLLVEAAPAIGGLSSAP